MFTSLGSKKSLSPKNSLKSESFNFLKSALNRGLFCALSAPFLACSALAAEQPDAANLEAIVVTATRTARTVDETLAPVTVITRQDIETSQAQSVAELLQSQPGLTVVNNGGKGKVSSIMLRGTNSDHVLILIDGVKIGSATTGTAAIQDIPVDLIERIEVVRGPRSSLYGSEAIGGVIQIFTKKGKGAAKPTLSVSAGSYSTWDTAATVSGGFAENGWYSAGLSVFDTQGFNACKGSLSAGCYANSPDKDGYRNEAARLRAGWRFDNGAEIEANFLRANGKNEFDGSAQNESKSVQQVFGSSFSFSPLERWHSTLRLAQAKDDADNFLNGRFASRFNTKRNQASWQNDFELAKGHQLLAGVDWLKDEVSGSTRYQESSRRNTGLFAQYLADLGRHNVQFSLRQDDNEQFGKKNTGGAAWGYSFDNDLRLTAAYGTAFKAPTFNQLYYPGFGSDQLRPELSRSLDVGVAGKVGVANWSLNAYQTKVTDLIGYDNSFNITNIDQARIHGLEASASARFADWNVSGNLNFLDPRNQGEGRNKDNLLPRRAQKTLFLSVDKTFGDWLAGLSLRAEGRRYDNLANTVKLGGFASVDLRAEYRINKAWRLQAKVENLFDRDYETAYLYNQAGRGAYLTLRYQP